MKEKKLHIWEGKKHKFKFGEIVKIKKHQTGYDKYFPSSYAYRRLHVGEVGRIVATHKTDKLNESHAFYHDIFLNTNLFRIILCNKNDDIYKDYNRGEFRIVYCKADELELANRIEQKIFIEKEEKYNAKRIAEKL